MVKLVKMVSGVRIDNSVDLVDASHFQSPTFSLPSGFGPDEPEIESKNTFRYKDRGGLNAAE